MQAKIMDQDQHKLVKGMIFLLLLGCLFFISSAFASSSCDGGSENTIGWIACNIMDSFSALAKLITAGAYIAGTGFILGAIFKFKAHKDNPTQIPIGTPIALLFIGAAMLFLPNVMTVAGTTIFTSQGQTAGTGGTDTFGNFTS